VLVLLADDVVFATSVTTPRFGKEAVEGLLRFRHRMRSQAQAAAGAVPAIAWGLPAEHGNVVKIPGAGASGSVEITWTFDVNDKICAFFLEGSQELMAAYVLSSDPVL